jgi:hypothetical protein
LIVAALRRAGHSHHIAATWRAIGFAAIGFGIFGALVLSVVLSVAPAGDIGAAIAMLAAAIPIVVGIISVRRGIGAQRESETQLNEAWSEAAAAVARSREGRIDARTLARATGLDDAAAESLLSQMTLKDRLAREVTGEGGLTYKLLDSDVTRAEIPTRVATDAASPSTSPKAAAGNGIPAEEEADDTAAGTSGRQGAGP